MYTENTQKKEQQSMICQTEQKDLVTPIRDELIPGCTMSVGDLVFCHGFRGLILETSHGMYSTEYCVYWFGLPDDKPFSWVSERQLLRIA